MEKKFNIKFNVTFNYGGWCLKFKKTFSLKFVPFYGLMFYDYDSKSGIENTIELANHDYCRTTIMYNFNKDIFYIDVRNRWPKTVSLETFDDVIKKYSSWGNPDDTTINKFRNFIISENNKIK